jgi:predicted nucleic acid-binding protein
MPISPNDLPTHSKFFLDTNSLIYLKFSSLSFHQSTKSIFLSLTERNNKFYISNQILREYISSCTREKLHKSYEELIFDCEEFIQVFEVLEDTKQVSISLLELCKKYQVNGKQVHDANITASMIANSIPYILTANVADFKRFSDLIKIIPIVEDNK